MKAEPRRKDVSVKRERRRRWAGAVIAARVHDGACSSKICAAFFAHLALRIKPLNKPTIFELLNEANIHETFGSDVFRLRMACRDLVEYETDAADRRIGDARELGGIKTHRGRKNRGIFYAGVLARYLHRKLAVVL